MAQKPFLKSIRPANLLSFSPRTEEIELRSLNILIGPNGSGKSNLIELIGLLRSLPDKEPWDIVLQAGGAKEWIWKGRDAGKAQPSLSVKASGSLYPARPQGLLNAARRDREMPPSMSEKPISYELALRERESGFEVERESFREADRWENDAIQTPWFERDGWVGQTHSSALPADSPDRFSNLAPSRSVLSMYGLTNISTHVPAIQKFSESLEAVAIYRDWVFGSNSRLREPQAAGLDSYRLAADSGNLAQVLKAWRDRGDQAVFERLVEFLRMFYAPIKDVDTELLGTYLRIMIKEDGLSSRTPAERLSDGTLRWLMLLIILLDPLPPPVICIDEPELGLHPDMLPVLADLLVEASTRTQLIVTTHSRSFLDSFTETPEYICVCEKTEGSTVIQRLDSDRLKVWLDDYSLGKLWTNGQIGGNRW